MSKEGGVREWAQGVAGPVIQGCFAIEASLDFILSGIRRLEFMFFKVFKIVHVSLLD